MKTQNSSRILACILAVSLLAAGPAVYGATPQTESGSAAAAQYSDVSTDHWAYGAIEACSKQGWFNGYADGTFHPKDLIRRDEAAKVFAEVLGLSCDKNAVATFSDTADNWARGYIEEVGHLFPDAVTLEVTSSFRPASPITREEAVYALVAAWRFADKAATCDLAILDAFPD
ncbi:MAG: S-layer homology domain-containing protein, partial [Oscillospiraceae bacterium]